ncbi:hypothetical protein ACJX0J_017919, partial [Zea mays]
LTVFVLMVFLCTFESVNKSVIFVYILYSPEQLVSDTRLHHKLEIGFVLFVRLFLSHEITPKRQLSHHVSHKAFIFIIQHVAQVFTAVMHFIHLPHKPKFYKESKNKNIVKSEILILFWSH